MTVSLADELRSIERAGADAFESVALARSTAPVVRRVGRRRTARAVGTGTVTVGAVTALVFGAGRLRDEGPTPGLPSPSPSLSPFPTPEATVIALWEECVGLPAVANISTNGELDPSALCWVTSTVALRADAALAFGRWSDAYEAEFGQRLCVVDGYRDLATQEALAGRSPSGPEAGTSEHGWGMAVDLCSLESRPDHQAWVDAHAGDFGWFSTDAEEPWHWTFVPPARLSGAGSVCRAGEPLPDLGRARTIVREFAPHLDDAAVTDAVIIASLIEREGRLVQDYARISRVIHNRLEAGMRLELDSTVHYAAGNSDGAVYTTPEARQNPHPYNTYVNPGLPPGPICEPGHQAIAAAVNPVPGNWFYFVTVNLTTGETAFASTYAEHLENVDRLREWERENAN